MQVVLYTILGGLIVKGFFWWLDNRKDNRKFKKNDLVSEQGEQTPAIVIKYNWFSDKILCKYKDSTQEVWIKESLVEKYKHPFVLR